MAKDTDWRPLEPEDHLWIAGQIHALLPLLEEDHRRYAWAYKLVDTLLWCWTADAVHPDDGQIKRDAIKHDRRYLHHTDAALKSLTHGAPTDDDKVQHEHAGERAKIIDVLRREGRTVDDIVEILTRLNHAVLVTAREHRDLGKRDWPADWRQRDWASHYHAKDIVLNPPTRLPKDRVPSSK